METNKEIEEMLNALGDKTPESASEKEEESDNEEKEEEQKQEEKEGEKKDEEKKEEEEEEKEEAPDEKSDEKEEEEKEDEEKEDEEETNEPDEKDKIIEDLRRQINEQKVERKEEPKEDPLQLDVQDFIGDLDPEELVRDKDSFNKILNSVYSKGVTDSKKISSEAVLRTIPDIVKNNINLFSALKKEADKFYRENEDLQPFKKVVAAVFEEISSTNPDKKYGELMAKVAPEVRKRLGLHKQAVEKEKNEGKPPRLPGHKGNQRSTPSKPNTSPLQAEIEAMNNSLRR